MAQPVPHEAVSSILLICLFFEYILLVRITVFSREFNNRGVHRAESKANCKKFCYIIFMRGVIMLILGLAGCILLRFIKLVVYYEYSLYYYSKSITFFHFLGS